MAVCVVGAGASGCICAYFLSKAKVDVTLFDYGNILRTLLPTGGGRCNLAHSEFDYKELASNYPRGEKFLYSVFSKFGTQETIDLFDELGIKTYIQDDGRIFPESNSAKDVRNKIINSLNNVNFVKEKVIEIKNSGSDFAIKTDKAKYLFNKVVVATGGFKNSFCIEGIPNTITECKPALVGLNTNIDKNLSGITLKNIYSKEINEYGDILFTHYGISGPLTYKISSYKAFEKLPYTLHFDLCDRISDLQEILNKNPHKDLKNIISEFLPHRFSDYLSGKFGNTKACNINSTIRDSILDKIHNFELPITGTNKGEETVTAGGYDLNEINSKTMCSKLHPNLYIIGEALNIDGLCGGFNLQNAWSTAYIAASSIIEQE